MNVNMVTRAPDARERIVLVDVVSFKEGIELTPIKINRNRMTGFLMKKLVALPFALAMALSLLNGSVQAEPGYAGEWKKTRLYGHAFNSGDFSDAGYDWIRENFEYFTIEKTHMRSIYGNPSHELTSQIAAARMVEANPRCKPLIIYSSGGAYPDLFESEAWALTNHPDYFVWSGGEPVSLNLSNPGENDWYIDAVNGICTNSDLVGVFVDGYKETYGSHPSQVQYMMEGLAGRSFTLVNGFDFDPGGLVIRDHPDLYEFTDGVFIDNFFRKRVTSAASGVVLLDACIAAPSDYMIVCWGSYDGGDDGWPTTHEFTHAAYLIVANDNTYYRWVGEGHNWSDQSLMTWHEDFGKKMGVPLGKATKNGYAYHRVFQHCTVDLNVQTKTSSIVWGQNNVPTNPVPIAVSDSYVVPKNQGTNILLAGIGPAGSSLTFGVVGLPLHGSLAGTAPALTYTPTNNYTGLDSFTFTVSNSVYASALATVTIQVNPDQSVPGSVFAWAAAKNISNANDVSTNGTPVWAYSFGASGSSVINGVTFTGESNAPGNADVMTDLDQSYAGYDSSGGTFITLPTAYQDILKTGAYRGGTDPTITLSGLTNGSVYEVQFWINDSRKRTDMDGRKATIENNTNNVVDYNTSVANTTGGIGQYIVGTFTADGPTQGIKLVPAPYPQLNAVQLRLISGTNSGSDVFFDWADSYGLIGDDALRTTDGENGGIGDGYNNLAEFALGMNPSISDARSRESVRTVAEGGANWFEYVHYRRSDYLEQGLSYLLMDSTNLMNSTIHTNAQDQILVGPAVGGYEPVTNRYRIDGPARFIQLKIRQD